MHPYAQGIRKLLSEAPGDFAHRTDEHVWFVVLDDRNQICVVVAFPRLGIAGHS